MCGAGTARRSTRCHDELEAALSSQKDRFEACLEKGVRVPSLHRSTAGRRPKNAFRLKEREAYAVQGWYVQFCDAVDQKGDTG